LGSQLWPEHEFTVVAAVPALCADAAEDAKPYAIKNESSIRTPSPFISDTGRPVTGAKGCMAPAALLRRRWSTH
jgi:hypothetical protein